MTQTKVLIIHDGWDENHPLMFLLKEKYGDQNVALENRSSHALDRIKQQQGEKLIVLLDFDLGHGEPHAPEVLLKIREYTSLIYVIVVTAKQFTEIKPDDLVGFINNNAFAITQNTADLGEIIALTEKATHQLDTSVECVLEQWISKRSPDEVNKPYMTATDGTTYSLKELHREIRLQTPIGKKLEKNILHLAIELLQKNN